MIALKFQNKVLVTRNPELGDAIEIPLGTQFKRSMTGTIWSYVRHNLPTIWNFTVAHLNRPQMLDLMLFLKESSGEEIQIIENAEAITPGPTWIGKVVSPNESTHVAVRNNTIQIKFVGIKK